MQVEPLKCSTLGTRPELDQRIFRTTSSRYITVLAHLPKC